MVKEQKNRVEVWGNNSLFSLNALQGKSKVLPYISALFCCTLSGYENYYVDKIPLDGHLKLAVIHDFKITTKSDDTF